MLLDQNQTLEKKLIFKKYPQYKKHFLKYDLGKLNLKVVEVEFDKSSNGIHLKYNDKTIKKKSAGFFLFK